MSLGAAEERQRDALLGLGIVASTYVDIDGLPDWMPDFIALQLWFDPARWALSYVFPYLVDAEGPPGIGDFGQLLVNFGQRVRSALFGKSPAEEKIPMQIARQMERQVTE